MKYIIKVLDERIKETDELYPLEGIYNVKINRSNTSNAVYVVSNKTGKRIRIGHYISEKQREWHIQNWTKGYICKKLITIMLINTYWKHKKKV